MADNIDLTQIANEIVRYGNANPLALQGTVLAPSLVLNKLNPTALGKVKGKWTFPRIQVGHVVQAFSDKWTPFGTAQFAKKVARNFHQKLNFLISPYDVYGTWLEEMYHEEKNPAEMPFSKYLIETTLPPIVISDLNILSVKGVYDPAQVGSTTPVFGKSMDGINIIVDRMVANTADPVFKIPVAAGLNVVDRVTAFENGLPEHANVDTIILSLSEFNDYVSKRETPSDKYIDFNDPQRGKTKFGRNIVGIPGLKPGRIIAWINGNFVRMYDRKDNPAKIDMVQVQDYDVKVFSQWHLGYDWAVNQFVFVETNNADDERGLNNADANGLYYPGEELIA